MGGINEAAANYDYVSTELWGKYLKEDCQKLLDELAQFNISPPLQPAVDEYEKSLEKMYLAGKYLESGGQENNMEDINLATEYMLEAGILTQRSISLMPT